MQGGVQGKKPWLKKAGRTVILKRYKVDFFKKK